MVRILLLVLLLSPVLSITATAFNNAALRDSVGVERRNGKFFIKHKVEPKETLYALSRKYGVPGSKIVESNPTVEASIRIDQIVLIPRTAPLSAAVTSATATTTKTAAPTASNRTFTVNNRGEKIHVVEAKQTLYSISRMHGVTVESIKTWNKLADNSIEIGAELIVGKGAVPTANKPVYVPEVDDEVEKVATTTPVSTTTTPAKTTPAPANTTPATIATSGPASATSTEAVTTVSEREEEEGTTETAAGVKKVIENGMAEMIDPKADTNKYLALHKSAPVGTIMQVKNAMNGQVVYVRVIGKLPETGTNNNVVVRISKKAYQKLGAVDQKFRVEVSYMP